MFSQPPAAGDAGPDTERPPRDDGWPGAGTGPSDEANVTNNRARGGTGEADDGVLSPLPDDGREVAREALRIFADDLTDESAARIRAMVDGPEGFDWGDRA